MRLIPAFILLAAASPALAQEPGEDWDLAVIAERQSTVAMLDFGDNLLALRCQAGKLDLLLTGVPVSTGATRTATVSAGAISGETQTWMTVPGQPVVGAVEPARLARQLRAGGSLDVRLDPETPTDRPRRYQLTAPPSSHAVNAVLTACGEPLEEPRDLIARVARDSRLTWTHMAPVRYPSRPGAENIPEAEVLVSCVVGSDLQLQDCRADSETPTGYGFGASAIGAAERSTIAAPADGTDVRGRIVGFTVRFSMSG